MTFDGNGSVLVNEGGAVGKGLSVAVLNGGNVSAATRPTIRRRLVLAQNRIVNDI